MRAALHVPLGGEASAAAAETTRAQYAALPAALKPKLYTQCYSRRTSRWRSPTRPSEHDAHTVVLISAVRRQA